MTPRALGMAAAALLVAGLLGTAQLTLARFTDVDVTTAEFAAAVLEPPTDVAGASGLNRATLTWTPTVTTRATGYLLLRSATSGSGYAQVADLTPVSLATAVDRPADGTWYYVLRTYFAGWESDPSNEAVATVGPVTTAFTDCAPGANAPVTTGAGDNNGYEGSPDSACGRDGRVATDALTGTSTTNSCTSNAKDKHDFWGFELGLPPTVGEVRGISVRPVAGMNNNGGTTWLCVRLSWDAGASWTAAQRVTLTSSALTVYSLGGDADPWGHAWTAAELGSGSFRLRVIDSSTHPQKQFRLDAIQVAVTYAP